MWIYIARSIRILFYSVSFNFRCVLVFFQTIRCVCLSFLNRSVIILCVWECACAKPRIGRAMCQMCLLAMAYNLRQIKEIIRCRFGVFFFFFQKCLSRELANHMAGAIILWKQPYIVSVPSHDIPRHCPHVMCGYCVSFIFCGSPVPAIPKSLLCSSSYIFRIQC